MTWVYTVSFSIAGGVLLIGFLMELITNAFIPKIQYPTNVIIFILFIVLIVGLYLLSGKYKALRWFYSVPAAVSAIILYTVLSIIMAFLPQTNDPEVFFLFNITSNYPYLFGLLFFLLTLGTTVCKRTIPFRKKNTGFILNHFGLWLAIAAANIGAGDIENATMYLQESQVVSHGMRKNKSQIKFPFAIRLNDFKMETYNPSLALVKDSLGNLARSKGKPAMIKIEDSLQTEINGFLINVQRYYPMAVPENDSFYALNTEGAVPAALITLTKNNTGREMTGWVSSGSYRYMPVNLKLNDCYTLVMIKPEPRRYVSDVTIYTKDKNVVNTNIEVNKPVKVNGWMIYQNGYEEKKGKFSTLSILGLTKDPWLPVVYTGAFLLIAGALFLIFRIG